MLFWGFNFISLKVLYPVMEPGAIMFWRYFVMGGVLVLVCKFTGHSLKIPAEHRNRILFAGLNSMGIYMILFMEGVKFTYAAEAAIILASNPIIVAIWMMVLKQEPRSYAKVVGGIIALVGVAVVILGRPGMMSGSVDALNRIKGDLLMLLGAISWSWSVVLCKPISGEIKPLPLFTMSMLGGLPVIFLFGLMPALQVHWGDLSHWQWANFAQISFGSGVIGMVFYYKGISQLPASVATLHQFLVPILATGFASLVLGEHLAWIQAGGLLIVIAGVGIANGLIKVRRTAEASI
ncbi:MAG: DMT family transporter [Armatimonadetes bacterium]|nr:DMT family transporter [Armatimonadota bacterium]